MKCEFSIICRFYYYRRYFHFGVKNCDLYEEKKMNFLHKLRTFFKEIHIITTKKIFAVSFFWGKPMEAFKLRHLPFSNKVYNSKIAEWLKLVFFVIGLLQSAIFEKKNYPKSTKKCLNLLQIIINDDWRILDFHIFIEKCRKTTIIPILSLLSKIFSLKIRSPDLLTRKLIHNSNSFTVEKKRSKTEHHLNLHIHFIYFVALVVFLTFQFIIQFPLQFWFI